jgi:hypothetical protein
MIRQTKLNSKNDNEEELEVIFVKQKNKESKEELTKRQKKIKRHKLNGVDR